MAIIKSCCCWRNLRYGCYFSGGYTLLYFTVTVVTMGHFIEVEQRYLRGEMEDPESESFLEPSQISPTQLFSTSHGWQKKLQLILQTTYLKFKFHKNYVQFTVALNITLLACSTLGLFSCILMVIGVYKDLKFMLLPWLVAMGLETTVEIINLGYLFHLQTMNFNPITSFLFTLDFFVIALNTYAMVCVISQFQEYLDGRGTAAFNYNDRVGVVAYTIKSGQLTTTSSAPSGRRRSAGKPTPSRHDPEEFTEVHGKAMSVPTASVLTKAHKSTVKKHVQFPDEQSCMDEATVIDMQPEEIPEPRVISSLWVELESEVRQPER